MRRDRTGGLFSNSVERQTVAAAFICRFDATTKFEFEKLEWMLFCIPSKSSGPRENP